MDNRNAPVYRGMAYGLIISTFLWGIVWGIGMGILAFVWY